MTPDRDIALTLHDDVPEDAGAIVDAGLGAANEAAAPLHEVRPLACIARDARGRVIGGAVGRTWGDCAEMQQLWVADAERRRGLGARLVRAFETHAQARGCHRFYLETFSFQAPSLYRKLGYETALAVRGFPHGIAKFTMLRELPVASPGNAVPGG
ncbi:MAG: GNAT family N-acetyltransferase [Pseudomonadota bacterium]